MIAVLGGKGKKSETQLHFDLKKGRKGPGKELAVIRYYQGGRNFREREG